MQHRHSRLRLNQKPHHAKQMERNLVTSILLYEAIRTTRKRAKVIQPIIDHVICLAKKNQGHQGIRAVNAIVTDKNACRKLMEVLVKRYTKRSSGFTTLKAAGARRGDGAQLVDLELMDRDIDVAGTAEALQATEKPAKKPKTKPVAKKDAASTEPAAS
jgi:large subunit ribosomal protein L17